MHQNPELSEHEFNTANRITKYLAQHSSGTTSRVASTGVMVTFDSGVEGESVLLRADVDALPIMETNNFEHKSSIPGVSHKCGHDGHTTIMLGVAQMLTALPITKGKVVLLFQPAEENGMGAEAVLKDKFMKDKTFDFIFALHNIPGFEKNQIVIKENVFNANVKSMIIQLQGKTAHAAEPEKGHNPALVIADILHHAESLTNNNPHHSNFFLITPIHINMGEIAYGISAGSGELHLTIRSWDLAIFDEKCADLEDFIKRRCESQHLKAHISWTQVFFANKNDQTAIEVVRKAAIKNEFDVHEMNHSFKWGEDFGLFTQKYKGAMFGLGAGVNTPALHNPDYDFPDDITSTGIQQFFQIIQELNTN
jgi:amidohydrolase